MLSAGGLIPSEKEMAGKRSLPVDDSDTLVAPSSSRRTKRHSTLEHHSHHSLKYIAFDAKVLPSPLEEYPVGGIVRLQLFNFVTYGHAVVHPGPRMNMLMGPNGSGKSSLVGAVALGLGAAPAVLGRSRDVAEYVRYGATMGYVEVCLRSTEGMLEGDGDGEGDSSSVTVLRIKRFIYSQNNNSNKEWLINERQSNLKAVRALVAKHHIQLDNLCTFLPQDRVSEFARMSPTELLMATLRAVGDPLDLAEFEAVQAVRSEEKALQQEHDDASKLIESRQDAARTLQSTVDALSEYREAVEQVELCEKKAKLLEYNEQRQVYIQAKTVRDAIREEWQSRDAGMEPVRQECEQVKGLLRRWETSGRRQLGETLSGEQEQVRAALEASLGLASSTMEAKREMERIRTTRERKERELGDLTRAIRTFEEETRPEAMPHVDPNHLKPELQAVALRIRSLEEREKGPTERQLDRIRQDMDGVRAEVDRRRRDIIRLDNVKEQRLEVIRRASPDTYKAWQWLEANRSQFSGPVHGPIALEVQVREGGVEGARAVENLLSRNILNSFIFTDYRDQERFMRAVVDERGLRANVVVVEASEGFGTGPERTAQLSSRLRGAGFDRLAIELVDGPLPVLQALCEHCQLHQIPVALRPSHTIDHEQVGGRLAVRKYCTADSLYQVRVSRYSPDDVLTRCTKLRPPGLFGDAADRNRRDQLQAEINTLHDQMRQAEATMRTQLSTLAATNEQIEQAREEQRRLTEQRAQRQRLLDDFNRKRSALDFKRSELSALQKSLVQLEGEAEGLEARLGVLLSQRFKAAETLGHGIREWHGRIRGEAGGEYVEQRFGSSRLQALQAELVEREAQHAELQERLGVAERDLESAKTASRRLLDEITARGLGGQEEALRHLPSTLPNVQRAMAAARLQAEQLSAQCRGQQYDAVVREMRNRTADLGRLEAEHGQRGERLAALRHNVSQRRSVLIARLTRLLTRISDAFSRFFSEMGTVGAVDLEVPEGVHPDDLDRYELAIRVKFRADEPLQRLSAHRQSGGEKSVSTILYLLALQDASSGEGEGEEHQDDENRHLCNPTQTPFRVVDEINQGMDATNERRIHRLLIHTAQSTHHTQYFLITPKLLPGLEYVEEMEVLCVYAGEGLFE